MNMYKNVEVILKTEHKDKGVKNIEGFNHAKELTASMLTLEEFYQACKSMPIVFAKNEDEGWFALALLGLENKNKFVNEDGSWKKDCYIPAYIRRYPFIYVKNGDELLLGFDASCKIDKKDAGYRYFFEDNEEPSEFTKRVLSFLNDVQKSSNATKEFIETLEEMKLLEESAINGKNAEGKDISINGFWVINEEKLNKISKKNKNKLCEKNYYMPITAHLISLTNIPNMA